MMTFSRFRFDIANFLVLSFLAVCQLTTFIVFLTVGVKLHGTVVAYEKAYSEPYQDGGSSGGRTYPAPLSVDGIYESALHTAMAINHIEVITNEIARRLGEDHDTQANVKMGPDYTPVTAMDYAQALRNATAMAATISTKLSDLNVTAVSELVTKSSQMNTEIEIGERFDRIVEDAENVGFYMKSMAQTLN